MITPEHFQVLLPLACAWAEEQERISLRDGVPLNAAQIDDAKRIGISHPVRVRLRVVDEIPLPDNPTLRSMSGSADFGRFWNSICTSASRSDILRHRWSRKQNGLNANCPAEITF